MVLDYWSIFSKVDDVKEFYMMIKHILICTFEVVV